MAELKTKSLHLQGKKWDITRETEYDVIDDKEINPREVVIARSGKEIHRFSPNITDDELKRFEKNNDFVSIVEENK